MYKLIPFILKIVICFNEYTLAKTLIAPQRATSPQNLVIGTLDADTDYIVYLHKEEVGVTKTIEATTNGSGLLTINLMDFPANFVRPNCVYFLWVTSPGANITAREDITIGSEVYTLLKIEFIRVQEYDPSDDLDYDAITATQTIEPVI